MILFYGLVALAVLALFTQLGVLFLQWVYPQQGKTIRVAAARLNIVDLGPRTAGTPIVMVHGASANLHSVRYPVGDLLAKRHRVILIDRPGHGWSSRTNLENSPPAEQAKMINEALEKIDATRAILVVHSFAGALGTLMALDYSRRIAGLVMLAPATHPWPGNDGWLNTLATRPVVGKLLVYTMILPVGLLVAKSAARRVFRPQPLPDRYLHRTASRLLLRPREFLANAWEMVTLKAALAEQALRYGKIAIPVTVMTDNTDTVASPKVHSFQFVVAVPHAKLIVLPDAGHVVQCAAPQLVVQEIEAMIAGLEEAAKAPDPPRNDGSQIPVSFGPT